MVTVDVSGALRTPRYVDVESGGGAIGDEDEHGDSAWRTCGMGRLSPGELVTPRVGLVKLRPTKIWLTCAAHQAEPRRGSRAESAIRRER